LPSARKLKLRGVQTQSGFLFDEGEDRIKRQGHSRPRHDDATTKPFQW